MSVDKVGWRRDYTDPIIPVIYSPLLVGDLVTLFADVKPNLRFTLFLNKVYPLSTIRGINLYDFAYNRKGQRSNFLIDDGVPVLFKYPPCGMLEDSPREWYKRNRVLIADLVRKYPGLFVMGEHVGGRVGSRGGRVGSRGCRVGSRGSRVGSRGCRVGSRGSRVRRTKKYIRRRRR
jgi:hypothetical protein